MPSNADPPPRLGLFGGSFDPIHQGHVALAQTATEQLRLSTLFFIPAAQAPLKSAAPGAPPEDRLEMVKIVAASNPKWEVLDWEIACGGVNYSADTVARFLKAYPTGQIFWILGDDQLRQLHRWHRADYLARSLHFAVYPREPDPKEKQPTAPPCSDRISDLRVLRLDACLLPISSTQIRDTRAAEKSISALVPPAVDAYIHKNKLYQIR